MSETPRLDRLAEGGVLEPVDRQLGALMGRLARRAEGPEPSVDDIDLTATAAALASRERGRGHSCLVLEAWAQRPLPGDGGRLPTAEHWGRVLAESPLVATGDAAAGRIESGDETQITPLVLDDRGRLYLYRYFRAERRLATRVHVATARGPRPPAPEPLTDLFNRLFPGPHGDGIEVDWQAVAAAACLCSPLALVSGGPGTGKTTTVARLLALLVAAGHPSNSQGSQRPPRIALAAPTGKAAARLGEAIGEQLARLSLDTDLAAAVPRQASTLHRLLGYRPRDDRFRHHRGEPIPCDVLVVDEASMVDLLMMDATLDALPPEARLILLGDKDQLSSVETGFVFGDLCAAAGLDAGNGDGPEGTDGLQPLGPEVLRFLRGVGGPLPGDGAPAEPPPLAAVELQVSYRFRHQPGIGALATAVRDRDVDGVFESLGRDDFEEISLGRHPSPPLEVLAPLADALDAYLDAGGPAEALRRLAGFRILCALRRGPWGVERLNDLVTRRLTERGHSTSDRWYRGRPVLVMANDYTARLFNGDLGVCWPEAGQLWAFFPDTDGPGDPDGNPESDSWGGGLRRLPLAKLPAHDTAWAMTIHKSQGSEFDRVLMVLPEEDHPLVDRELLYTGITRARRRVHLVADRPALAAAVQRTGRRVSGLAQAIVEGDG
ncbi:MAG: exodeoxyribonuclease V subunit alpha [Acidobacteriota bacterium]